MTSTPENGASTQPAADQHPQTHPTQPLPPVQPAQPPVVAPSAQPHPTNPFRPPHPAAPADQRAAYEAAQRAAAPQPDHRLVGAYAGPPGPEAPAPERRRSIWLPVTSAAAAAAIVAVLATVGVTQGLSDDEAAGTRPASLAEVGQPSNDSVPVAGSTSEDPDWEAVATAVQQSVVAIQVGTGSQGSGVIVDDAGHIVTNNHVVAGADGDVQVTLTDGRIFNATIVGTDAVTDLAVLQLEDAPDDLQAAALGDSSEVVVGQPVMAVGNPLGLASTVTTGIVSAVDRPVSTSGDSTSEATITNAIQIDAAVNPGNSGGPLFDASGRVIGINSSIATLSSQSGSIGLGFAIPVDLVKNIAQQLIDDGTAEHAFLGVSLSDGTATADGVTRRGAIVEEVSEGSPAAEAQLQAQDAIVAIDGDAVGGAESLTAYVRALPSGTDVTLTVVRDGEAIEVDVTLAVRQETAAPAPQQEDRQGEGGSVNPEEMTPEELWDWFQQQGQGG